MDMSKIDLNAPAFGAGSQTAETLESTDTTTTETPVEEVVTEPTAIIEPSGEAQTSDEPQTQEPSENPVPYSRFKKFHDKATQSEREALEWKAKYEALTANPVQPASQATSNVPDMPNYWVQLYGDSDQAKQAWEVQAKQNQDLIAQARQEAIDAYKSAQQEESQQVNDNMALIDEELGNLSDNLGRDLSDTETEAVLEIVDEYTPKDKNGNYLGAIIPLDKAWEIYELKQNAAKAPKKQARNNVAAITATQSQGDPTAATAERDKNWTPNWDSFRDRLS